MASSIPTYNRDELGVSDYLPRHYTEQKHVSRPHPRWFMSATCCRSVGSLLHDHPPAVCQAHLGALPDNDVHVWITSVGQVLPILGTLQTLLSVDEQAKALRFAHDQRRQQYIVGRGMLRALLSGYLDYPREKVVFAHNAFGKLSVAGVSWLNFNVSHSHDTVVLVFAKDRSLGIDVQKVEVFELTPEIANRVLSPRELSRLQEVDDQQKLVAFSRTWVIKEAYLKAIGCGLSQPLHQLEVSLTGDEHPTLRTRGENDAHVSRWELRELRLAKGYTAAIAVEGHDWRLKCWSIDTISESDVARIP